MTRILIVRHGRTDFNTTGRFQGQTDIPLSPQGEIEARATAEALRGLAVASIVASDLLRARQTAEILANAVGAPVEVCADLRERSFGRWEGLTRDEVASRFAEDFGAWLENAGSATDGESDEEVARRVLGARDRVRDGHVGACALIVSHMTPVRLMLGDALGLSPAQSRERLTVATASVSELRWRAERGWRVTRVNWTPGLEDRG